ncbi:hypothetical protein [Psychrobacter sp. 1Y7]|uniref:hypothetical protein n=1 Tax=Psychrobacter sp. 1Y7 TaxID=3457442 RepID=UPI003FD3EB1E
MPADGRKTARRELHLEYSTSIFRPKIASDRDELATVQARPALTLGQDRKIYGTADIVESEKRLS